MRQRKSRKLSGANLNLAVPVVADVPVLPTARRGVLAAISSSILGIMVIVAAVSSIGGSDDLPAEQNSLLAVLDEQVISGRAGAISAESIAAEPGLVVKTTSKPSKKPTTKPATKPSTSTTKKTAPEKNQDGQATRVVESASTPAPVTTSINVKGIEGSQIPNGATVGNDIPAGRYWSKNCWSWSVTGPNGTIASSSYRFTQSVIDVQNGEFFLTSTKCTWFAGTPPAATTLPTGKVIVGEQLTEGRWRAVNQDGCVTGPTSTRNRAAITDQSNMIVWWPNTKDLVITGNEDWTAYLVGVECGGMVRVG